MGTFSPNMLLSLLAFGESAANGFDNWGESANSNFSKLDTKLGGKVSLSLAAGDITLSASNETNLFLDLTGTINAARLVNISSRAGFWLVSNQTVGNYTVSLKPDGGTATELPSGTSVVYSDGSQPVVVNSSATPACFCAIKASSQNILTPAVIIFGTELVDEGGYFDPVTSRWTPPEGIYRVSVTCSVSTSSGAAGTGSGYNAAIALRKNGSPIASSNEEVVSPENNYGSITLSAIVAMNGTDYLDVYGAGTGALDVQSVNSAGWAGASMFSGEAI